MLIEQPKGGAVKKLSILCAIFLAMTACSTTQQTNDAAGTMDAKKAEMEQKVEAAKDEAKAATTGTTATKAACTLDKDTRVIEVRKTDSGGCELFYTKFGEEKSVASSGFGTQYCEEVKDRIQTNLNKAGFSCQ